MVVPDTAILRIVERKIDREGLEPAKVDILVMHGHVTLTGLLVTRITQQSLNGPEIERFEKELKRIDGVNEVTFHLSDAVGFA